MKKTLNKLKEKIREITNAFIRPDAEALWRGIGGQIETFTPLLLEFIDNSISNINANLEQGLVIIGIEELDNSHEEDYLITIEDNGTGIPELGKAMTIGNLENQNSTYNEHGYGVKNALSTADPENKSWEIYTRTIKDIKKNEFKKVSYPYDYNIPIKKIVGEGWPSLKKSERKEPGTIIRFKTDHDFLCTIGKGHNGYAGKNNTLDKIVGFLLEELGVIYRYDLNKGVVTLKIFTKTN